MVKTHGEGEEEEKRSPYRQVAWEWAKGNKEAAEDKEVEAGKQTRHDLDKAMGARAAKQNTGCWCDQEHECSPIAAT